MEVMLFPLYYFLIFVAITVGFSIGFWNLSNLTATKKSSKTFMKTTGIFIGLSISSSLSLLDYNVDMTRYTIYTIILGSWLFGLGSSIIKKYYVKL